MTGQSPRDTVAGRIVVGFLVAGCFLVGFVLLFALCAWLYTVGVPAAALALGSVVVLGGVFVGLSRWAESRASGELPARSARPELSA